MNSNCIELANKLAAEGFIVYLAKSQTHGVFTAKEGRVIVLFSAEPLGFGFYGCYTSKWCGTGWKICSTSKTDAFATIINDAKNPPYWATLGEYVALVSIDKFLDTYKSSCYRLVTAQAS